MRSCRIIIMMAMLLLTPSLFANCSPGNYWNTDAKQCPATHHAIATLQDTVNNIAPANQITEQQWLIIMNNFSKMPAYSAVIRESQSKSDCAGPLFVKLIQQFQKDPIDGYHTYQFATFTPSSVNDDPIANVSNGLNLLVLAESYTSQQDESSLLKAIYWYKQGFGVSGICPTSAAGTFLLNFTKAYVKLGQTHLAFCQIYASRHYVDPGFGYFQLAQFYAGTQFTFDPSYYADDPGSDPESFSHLDIALLNKGTLASNINAYAFAKLSESIQESADPSNSGPILYQSTKKLLSYLSSQIMIQDKSGHSLEQAKKLYTDYYNTYQSKGISTYCKSNVTLS